MESAPVRKLYGNAANFSRALDPNDYKRERPLLLNAWAQTTQEDFDLVNDEHLAQKLELQNEVKTLREKIRSLEDDLQIHVELLNQIHATAALKFPMTRTKTEFTTQTPPVTPVMQQPQQQQQHQRANYLISPIAARSSITTLTTMNNRILQPQIINANQIQTETPHPNGVSTSNNCSSIKYTIVTGTEQGSNHEPIEIQLAEENDPMGLNDSADSGRLEICLNANEQTEANHNDSIKYEMSTVKTEQQINGYETPQNLPAQSGILIKRRKVDSLVNITPDTKQLYNGYNNQLKNSTSTPINSQNAKILNSQSTSMPMALQTSATPNNIRYHNDDNVMVSIGPNNTRIPSRIYESINWESPSIATRKLLMAIFDRHTLATHSMTGKPSPAFKGQCKPAKKRLDPSVTEDIVFAVTRRCKVSDKEVRNAITTKCADENKMMKLQLNKTRPLRDSNKENEQNGTNQSFPAMH